MPYLRNQVGAGEVVRKITQAVGISPCGSCKEREKKMNEVQFVPRREPHA